MTVARWVRGLWTYYRGYTRTAIHAASTATLTIFGLLAIVDPLFVVVAIVSYVVPPIALYATDADLGRTTAATDGEPPRDGSERVRRVPAGGSKRTGGDTDGDSDSDSDGRDGDSDADGTDTDSDGTDTDTDSDSDG
ncbi:hypothetical protein [Halomarina ordinaria]|uniref:DUF2892 domain-containing protein n=1 Tax=Halomarina ordinaria TaxID=3033939 RepID=A0ABD5UAA6_9EURY|nr:hypothetical protein [Halomarina sp. PSRA2]